MEQTDRRTLRLQVAAAARSVYAAQMPYPVFISRYGGIDDPPIARLTSLMEKEASALAAHLTMQEYASIQREALAAIGDLERDAGAA